MKAKDGFFLASLQINVPIVHLWQGLKRVDSALLAEGSTFLSMFKKLLREFDHSNSSAEAEIKITSADVDLITVEIGRKTYSVSKVFLMEDLKSPVKRWTEIWRVYYRGSKYTELLFEAYGSSGTPTKMLLGFLESGNVNADKVSEELVTSLHEVLNYIYRSIK